MSLIITVSTSEGIIMASDSRATYDKTDCIDNHSIISHGVHFTNTAYKTFLCDNRIGISTCGSGNIRGKSIASHIENYINNEYSEQDTVEMTAQKLLTFFSNMPHTEPVVFHVAGYDRKDERDVCRMYRVVTIPQIRQLAIEDTCGAQWDGESGILTRLMKSSFITPLENVVVSEKIKAISLDETGSEIETEHNDYMLIPKTAQHSPEMAIAWDLMTLQDGIDFAVYAIKTTIDTMRFQLTAKTVGEPIDILVIKPNESKWIKHKELHA